MLVRKQKNRPTEVWLQFMSAIILAFILGDSVNYTVSGKK